MSYFLFAAKVMGLSFALTLGVSAEPTQWTLSANTPGDWSTSANWSLSEPTAGTDALIGGIARIEQDGEVCRDLQLGSGSTFYCPTDSSSSLERWYTLGDPYIYPRTYSDYRYLPLVFLNRTTGQSYEIIPSWTTTNSPGMVELFSGSLKSRCQYIGYSAMGHFLQMGGTNTTDYLEIRSGSLYEFRSGNLQVNDGLKLIGNLDLDSQPVMVSTGNAIVDLSKGSVLHGNSATFSAGPESLVIYKAGTLPNTLFGTFSCEGLLHEAGQTLTIDSTRTIRGTGTIQDPVECAGRIYAARNGYINLTGGLNMTRMTEIDLGTGSVTLRNANDHFDSRLSAGTVSLEMNSANDNFVQTGGLLNSNSVLVSIGNYHLNAGTIRISPPNPQMFPDPIQNLSAAPQMRTRSNFYLGNAETTGSIEENIGGPAASLWIFGNDPWPQPTSKPNTVFQGWGDVGLTGTLTNYGQIIADGYGVDRTLDMSRFSSVNAGFGLTSVRCTSGCFAQDHGKLILPLLASETNSNLFVWGDSQTLSWNWDDQKKVSTSVYSPPDAVNSLQMKFSGLDNNGRMTMSLLATDRDDLPAIPDKLTLLDIWQFEPEGTVSFDSVDLTIRYDDTLTANLGLSENTLHVYSFDNGEWVDVTSGMDLSHHWLYANDLKTFSLLAVGVPEPATLLLLTVGAGLLRRRPETPQR